LGMYAYHMTLLCFLVVVSLIEWDRLRTPKRITLAGLLAGFLFPSIWPNLHPVAWWMPRPEWLTQWPWLERLDTSLVGVIAGACLGALLAVAAVSRGRPPEENRDIRTNAMVSMTLAGLFLGWQAAISVAAFGAVYQSFAAVLAYLWPRIAALPVAGWILAATALHLSLWETLSAWSFWPGAHSGVLVISVACIGIVGACVLARLLFQVGRPDLTVEAPTNEGVLS